MPPSEMQASFCRTAAYVDHHIALRRLYVQTGAQRRSHRFVDHIDLASPGMFGGIPHGTDLDIGRAGRNADHHADRGGEEIARRLDFLDHAAQHQLRSVEIGDHAVLQRTDRLDVRIGLLVHLAGLRTDSHQLTRVYVQRHDGRLVYHDLPVVNDQSIGRTQVDSQLLRQ